MTDKEFMVLVNRYVEACDDLGAGLFQQTEAETNAKHAKAKELHGQIATEVNRLHAELAKFTPLRAHGVVDADNNLDGWDTPPFQLARYHVADLNARDPAAMWRLEQLYIAAPTAGMWPNVKVTG